MVNPAFRLRRGDYSAARIRHRRSRILLRDFFMAVPAGNQEAQDKIHDRETGVSLAPLPRSQYILVLTGADILRLWA
jgi:hypothetical protein